MLSTCNADLSGCHILRYCIDERDGAALRRFQSLCALLIELITSQAWVRARRYVPRPTPRDHGSLDVVDSEVCADTLLLFLTTLGIRVMLLDWTARPLYLVDSQAMGLRERNALVWE